MMNDGSAAANMATDDEIVEAVEKHGDCAKQGCDDCQQMLRLIARIFHERALRIDLEETLYGMRTMALEKAEECTCKHSDTLHSRGRKRACRMMTCSCRTYQKAHEPTKAEKEEARRLYADLQAVQKRCGLRLVN